eukprot:9403724-Pyramimonas_sp.AAC.1
MLSPFRMLSARALRFAIGAQNHSALPARKRRRAQFLRYGEQCAGAPQSGICTSAQRHVFSAK